jgi:hypothetical protein
MGLFYSPVFSPTLLRCLEQNQPEFSSHDKKNESNIKETGEMGAVFVDSFPASSPMPFPDRYSPAVIAIRLCGDPIRSRRPFLESPDSTFRCLFRFLPHSC